MDEPPRQPGQSLGLRLRQLSEAPRNRRRVHRVSPARDAPEPAREIRRFEAAWDRDDPRAAR